ncbi:aminoacyl-tRNA deacylase [Gorillibacterium massiliense]|uniref:aminoacyl-tRNA deacylase n=1 Tax=Gorillibacterium massiliense TaxID=1280390 RepID=UPI0004B43E8E|nr:YbaK/EbsC family protein [Gorillibacterium massiliense]
MDKLIACLKQKDVRYDIIEHEAPILSAQDGERILGIELGQTAPILILKAEAGFYSLIFSGDRDRLDFAELASKLNLPGLKLAKPKEVEKLTGFSVGSVPMAGLSFPCILDRRLFRYPYIYGGSGSPTHTLKLEPSALERLHQVIAYLD